MIEYRRTHKTPNTVTVDRITVEGREVTLHGTNGTTHKVWGFAVIPGHDGSTRQMEDWARTAALRLKLERV